MYHYIYRITVDDEKYKNHYYYGKHSTNNLDDGYVGSGIKISRLKKKGYTLIKEILVYFNSSEEAFIFEEILVDEEMLSDPFCMNLRTGGGSDYKYTSEARLKMSNSAKERGVSHLLTKEVRDKAKIKQSSTRTELWKTPEYREKMKNRKKGKGRSTGTFVTPNGNYTSRNEAAIANGVSPKTIYNWCKQNKNNCTFQTFNKEH